MAALLETSIPDFPVRRGKVRDVYDLGEQLLIVATDRLSAFDVILPTGIPEKGIILTQLSNFWFKYFTGKVAHHLLATDLAKFPAALRPYRKQLQGRAIITKKAGVIPIECVVRGYLAGSGWKDYQKSGAICGVKLPPGLRQSEQLPQPIFTPTTKAQQGHDEAIIFDAAAEKIGRELMTLVRDRSIEIYRAAAAYARARGIILADTKFEWGLVADSPEPILIDEILTPDSSRFWPADQYAPGRDQPSYDKQYVRNYLETLDWPKTHPGPKLPDEVVTNTRRKYVEAFEQLTGEKFAV